jgi:hypothetical protein
MALAEPMASRGVLQQSEIRAQSEGLRSYAGMAHIHRLCIVLYHTLPEVALEGDEDETSGHRKD